MIEDLREVTVGILFKRDGKHLFESGDEFIDQFALSWIAYKQGVSASDLNTAIPLLCDNLKAQYKAKTPA